MAERPSDDDPRVRAAATKRRRTRARLVEAASQVAREEGVDLRMERVAERANVSIATLYNFFPGKGEMFRQAFWEVVVQPLAEFFRSELVDNPGLGMTGYVVRLRRYSLIYSELCRGMMIDRLEGTNRRSGPDSYDCIAEIATHLAVFRLGEDYQSIASETSLQYIQAILSSAVIAMMDRIVLSPETADIPFMWDSVRFSFEQLSKAGHLDDFRPPSTDLARAAG